MTSFYDLSITQKKNWCLNHKITILTNKDWSILILKNKRLKQFWNEIFFSRIKYNPEIINLVPLTWQLKEIILIKNEDLFYKTFSVTEIKEMLKFGPSSLAIHIFKGFYKISKDYSNEEIEYILLNKPYYNILYETTKYITHLSDSFLNKINDIDDIINYRILKSFAFQIYLFDEETINKLSKNEKFNSKFSKILSLSISNNKKTNNWFNNYVNGILNNIDILNKCYSNNLEIKKLLKTIELFIFK